MHTRVDMHRQPGLQGHGSPPCSWPQPVHSLHPPTQRSPLRPPWPMNTDIFRLGGGGCESGEGERAGRQGRRSSEGRGWGGPPPFPLRGREGQTRSLHRSPVSLGLAISLSRRGGSEDSLSLRAKPAQPEDGDSLWLRRQPGYPCSLQWAWPVNTSEVRWAATQRRPTGHWPWLGETPRVSVAPERVCSVPEKPAQWTCAHPRGRGQGSIIALSLFLCPRWGPTSACSGD